MPDPSQPEELVVLVNDRDEALGTAPKAAVHTDHTPLHRAFSVFLFGSDGRLLFQQRSHLKKTWPLLWAGSCCGHPGPGEATEAAIRRRVGQELGLADIADLQVALPDFRYRIELDGIVENEICPVWLGRIAAEPMPDPAEVEAIAWLSWADFLAELAGGQRNYAEWCRMQALQLPDSAAFRSFP